MPLPTDRYNDCVKDRSDDLLLPLLLAYPCPGCGSTDPDERLGAMLLPARGSEGTPFVLCQKCDRALDAAGPGSPEAAAILERACTTADTATMRGTDLLAALGA